MLCPREKNRRLTIREGRYRLGLVLLSIMLLGTSRSRYPTKKIERASE
jgi:hypothetical protein